MYHNPLDPLAYPSLPGPPLLDFPSQNPILIPQPPRLTLRLLSPQHRPPQRGFIILSSLRRLFAQRIELRNFALNI